MLYGFIRYQTIFRPLPLDLQDLFKLLPLRNLVNQEAVAEQLPTAVIEKTWDFRRMPRFWKFMFFHRLEEPLALADLPLYREKSVRYRNPVLHLVVSHAAGISAVQH
jgi:hypothetical protein